MKKARVAWKVIAVALCGLAALNLVVIGFRPFSSIVAWMSGGALLLASTGALQYYFDWPRLPRLLWRVFGPLFSLGMVLAIASGVGWLGTRLAIKHLTLGEQASTAALLLTLPLYGFATVFPLYRLGEWNHLSGEQLRTSLRPYPTLSHRASTY